MKTKKNLKLAIVLFAMIFAVGAAFAATNGILAFGGIVRINNVTNADVIRLEFVDVTHAPWDESILTVETSIQNTETGRKRLQFDIEINDIQEFFNNQSSIVNFTIQNTGSVPVRIIGTHDFEMSGHPRIGANLRNGDKFLNISDGSIYTGDAELFGSIEPGQYITGSLGVGSPRFLPGNGFIPLPDEGYTITEFFEIYYEQAQ